MRIRLWPLAYITLFLCLAVALYDSFDQYLNRSVLMGSMDETGVYGTLTNGAATGGLSGNLKIGSGGQILTAGDDWNYISSAKVDYYSAHTLLVTGLDARTVLQAGDKIKLEQASTTKYFTVQYVTADYVTLNATPTYSLTADDINLFGYSRVVNPTGWVNEERDWTYLAPNAFTYSSATQLNINSSLLSYNTFNVGDKLVIYQNSAVKYFYVYNKGSSYINITGGTSYTLTAGTISYIGYSRLPAPSGHPIRFSYTPTLTAASPLTVISQGSVTAWFSMNGDICTTYIRRINANLGGSAGVPIYESAPLPIASGTNNANQSIGYIYSGAGLASEVSTTSSQRFSIFRIDQADILAADVTQTFTVSYKTAHN